MSEATGRDPGEAIKWAKDTKKKVGKSYIGSSVAVVAEGR